MAAGHEDGATWGKRAAWVDYWGTLGDAEVGVAIFDHPTVAELATCVPSMYTLSPS